MSPVERSENESDETLDANDKATSPLEESGAVKSNDSENLEDSEGKIADDDLGENSAENHKSSLESVSDDEVGKLPEDREQRNLAKKKRTRKKTASGVIVASLMIGGVVTLGVWSNTKTEVPSAEGSTSSQSDAVEACESFEKASLKCDTKWKTDSAVPRGDIISQSIDSGETVKKNSEVILTYSIGPETSKFPNLKNVEIKDAEETLYEMNVSVKEIKEVNGHGLEKGHIVSSNVKPGAEVKNGDEIIISVSSGKISVPNWKNKTQEYVEADAKKLGIDVNFKSEESKKTSGVVISQTPAAGEVSSSSKVDVVVSKAFKSKSIKVPDVIGKTDKEAKTKLATDGFRHIKTVSVKNSEVTKKQVTQIVPGVGQTGKSEENVVIIVSEPSK